MYILHCSTERNYPNPLSDTLVNAVVFTFFAIRLYRQRHTYDEIEKDDVLLRSENDDGNVQVQRTGGFDGIVSAVKNGLSTQTWTATLAVALAFTLANSLGLRYITTSTLGDIHSAIAPLTTIALLLIMKWTISATQWIAIFLITCGGLVLSSSINTGTELTSTHTILAWIQLLIKIAAIVLLQKTLQRSTTCTNTVGFTLFGLGVGFNAVLAVRSASLPAPLAFSIFDPDTALVLLAEVLAAASLLPVLKYYDAFTVALITITTTAVKLVSVTNYNTTVLSGGAVLLLAIGLYFTGAKPLGSTNSSPEMASMEFGSPALSSAGRAADRKSVLFHAASGFVVLITLTISAIFINLQRDAFTSYGTPAIPEWVPPMNETLPLPLEELAPEVPLNMTLIGEDIPKSGVISSPFANTVAIIRINHYLPEREKLIRDSYGPFFHSIHISMPGSDEEKKTHGDKDLSKVVTLERDYWDDSFLPYQPVLDYLALVDDEVQREATEKKRRRRSHNEHPGHTSTGSPSTDHAIPKTLPQEQATSHHAPGAASTRPYSELQSLLYFHFDAWVSPLSYTNTFDARKNKIWYLTHGVSIPHKCMVDTPYREPEWLWFKGDRAMDTVMRGNKEVLAFIKSLPADDEVRQRVEHTMDEKEFCMGWSDMYYIPKRFFPAFQALGGAYANVPTMHEVALPTIWRIIERAWGTYAAPMKAVGQTQDAQDDEDEVADDADNIEEAPGKPGKVPAGRLPPAALSNEPPPPPANGIPGIPDIPRLTSKVAPPTASSPQEPHLTAQLIESPLHEWSECWGGCCSYAAFAEDILERPCGHKIDYLKWHVTKVHYDRLESQARVLGLSVNALNTGVTEKNPGPLKAPMRKA